MVYDGTYPRPVSTGGTGVTSSTAYGLLTGGTTTTGAFQTVTPGTAHTVVTSGGTGALHTYTSAFKITSDVMTNTAQPAVLATFGSSSSNATGDSTLIDVVFATSVFDQASNYNASTGVFTAPVTGKYLVSGSISYVNLGAGHTGSLTNIVATSRTLTALNFNPFSVSSIGGTVVAQPFTAIIDMTATNTLKIQTAVYNSTKTVGINNISFLSISLLC